MRGLELCVRHGETVALVGPNGCGKSTLMNLLPRFWDVQSGSIRVDGHDLRDVQVRSLRSQIGYVTQETVLFEGTDRREPRLRVAARDSRDQVIEAAKRSYAHTFIEALPAGVRLAGGRTRDVASPAASASGSPWPASCCATRRS